MKTTETSKSKTLEASPIIATNFEIVINDDVYQKVMYWVNKSDHEVSGFGNVEFDKAKKIFRVTDAILLKQENGPTSSEIDPVAIGKAMYEMRDKPNGLKWWWHSHVNMGVFWSADDMNCIRGLGQRGWLTATVFNKRCEMRSAFYDLTTVMDNTHEMFCDEIKTRVERLLSDEQCRAWDAEYDAHVIERKMTPIRPSYQGFPGGIDYYGDGYGNAYDRNYGRIYGQECLPFSELTSSQSEQTELDKGKKKWDKEGWGVDEKGFPLYNPARDTGVVKMADKWEEALALEQEQFNYLLANDTAFQALVNSATNMPTTGV